MKTFSKEINIECDIKEINILDCWAEDMVVLNWWQPARDGLRILKGKGWYISKTKDICPYCSKGIKQKH